jgi:exodeoxyribonuclease V alpha subunit
MKDETLEGEILRFSYRAEDDAFAVAVLRVDAEGDDGGEQTVVGPIGHITEGQHVRLVGRWMLHTSFGRQFRVSRSLVEDPRTLKGLTVYLSSGAVQGMGPSMAARVVERFGLETLKILESDPTRLKEVPGIGDKRMRSIAEQWKQDAASRQLHAILRGYGVGAALTRKVVETYGDDAMSVITRQPYRLAAEIRGIGFKTADLIATERGQPLDAPERAAAALIHVLREAEGQGHCYIPRGELLDRVEKLQVPRSRAEEQLTDLARRGDAVIIDAQDAAASPVYRPGMDTAESRVVLRLRRLLSSAPPEVTADLSAIEARLSMELSGGQRDAIQMALSEGFSIITGGPGTGKTTIVRVLMTAAGEAGEEWLLAAPTGRAARRLAEATGQGAKTIHRLLEFNGRTRRFNRGFANPLDCDGVLIDEASMIDIRLMDDLLSAIPPACRVVLVGDADQLPSVGPGQVLADLIASGVLPVTRLTEVYRQSAQSGIVLNAHRINRGEPPLSGELESPPRDDFFQVHREDPLEAQSAILQIISSRMRRRGFDPLCDVQVLTPMHGGPLGTVALNLKLQALLNPDGAVFRKGERLFREGDRVLQVRNDYDNDIFNGDVGRVVSIGEGGIVVDFDGQRVVLAGEKLADLQLAYAISVHKSQGSEYPAVITVLHRVHRIMLKRNLLYTAITRAKSFCCVIDTPWAVRTAVAEAGGADRWTGLVARLKAASGG